MISYTNVMDDVTRECLAVVVDTSISGPQVERELARLVGARGEPRMIVSDDSKELPSKTRCCRDWLRLGLTSFT